jgi:hypothetical protein
VWPCHVAAPYHQPHAPVTVRGRPAASWEADGVDRIERHDLINALALAAVLMTLALLLIVGARELFRTVDEGLVVSSPSGGEATATTVAGEGTAEGGEPGGGEPAAPAEGEAAPDDPDEAAATTTTVAPPRPPGEVAVRVANGAQRVGVAAAGGGRLESLGYQVVGLANAAARPTSVVWFVEGFEPEARAVAEALGVPAGEVGPVPADPGVDVTGASVLVVLGADTSVA